MERCVASYDSQKRKTDAAQESVAVAEKAFFLIDKSLSRFAENLEDVLLSKQIIEDLDKEK